MKISLSRILASSLLCFASFALPGTAAQQTSSQAPAADSASQASMLRIAKEVRKAILTLPEYGVFDYIHFAIKGRTVILRGEASRPILKSSAENVVKKIEGVESVQNDIGVLPNSPNDDRIRAAVYYRIYSQPSLQKYTSNRGPQFSSLTRRTAGITYDPPIGYHAIHIVVKNGNVTLVGAVDNSSDAAIAGMQANLTPGVFSVDNDLFVASKDGK
jgi:hyperosmotically inducible periplasmic protein